MALRVHLDDSTPENGPLRVLPGTQPSYRIIRDRATLEQHVLATHSNERWHLALFLTGLFTQVVAFASAQWAWLCLLTVTNMAFNLYPVMHQRCKRARLRRLEARR